MVVRCQVQVEWIILADAVQVVNDKLYLMGGGWKILTVNTPFPVPQTIGLAVSYEVPWAETNMPHASQIEIQTADGQVLAALTVQFEVGRPAGLPAGPQRFQFGANINLPIERDGTYVIVTKVDGQPDRRVDFHVVAGPGARGLAESA
jgi:hypothetical protein